MLSVSLSALPNGALPFAFVSMSATARNAEDGTAAAGNTVSIEAMTMITDTNGGVMTHSDLL